MARARLFLRRGDDPDVLAKLARNRFEQLEAPRIHAVVIGEEDPHVGPMREPRSCCNSERHTRKLRHIRNSLAISSRCSRQCLLTLGAIIIGGSWGRQASPDKLRES